MNLTHRHIDVFRAIMEAPSLTAAATMMGTSQPTLSRELSELEDILTYKLFLRVGRRLQPTASGISLFKEIQRSYIGLNHILATAKEIGKFAKGQLSIVCMPGLAHTLLPAVCRRFQEGHQGVGLSLVPQEPPLLAEWLTAQRHDLGLIERDEAPMGTHQEEIFNFEEICVLPNGHPLLEKDVLYPSDFQGEHFISQSPSDPVRMQLDEIFRQHGIRREMLLESHDSSTICRLVKERLGVAIVNPVTALSEQCNEIELRRFGISVPYCVNIVRPEFRPFTPLINQFIEAIKLEIAHLQSILANH